jgi:hypothetical protein
MHSRVNNLRVNLFVSVAEMSHFQDQVLGMRVKLRWILEI